MFSQKTHDNQNSIRFRWYFFILGPSVLLILYQVGLMTFSLGKKSIEVKTIVNTLSGSGSENKNKKNIKVGDLLNGKLKKELEPVSHFTSSILDPSIFDLEFVEEKEGVDDLDLDINTDVSIAYEDDKDAVEMDLMLKSDVIPKDGVPGWDREKTEIENPEPDTTIAKSDPELINEVFAPEEEEPDATLSIWDRERQGALIRDNYLSGKENRKTIDDVQEGQDGNRTDINDAGESDSEQKSEIEISDTEMKIVDENDSKQKLEVERNDMVSTELKSPDINATSKNTGTKPMANEKLEQQRGDNINKKYTDSEEQASSTMGSFAEEHQVIIADKQVGKIQSENLIGNQFEPSIGVEETQTEKEGENYQEVEENNVAEEDIEESPSEPDGESEIGSVDDSEKRVINEDEDQNEENEENIKEEAFSENRLEKEEETVLHTKFKEQLLSQDENNRLALKLLEQIVPGGEYVRWLRDDIYRKNVGAFTRFRSRLQLQNLQLDLVDFYGKIRPDLQPVYLSIGLGGAKGKGNKRKHLNSLQLGNPNRGRHVFLIGGLHGCQWAAPLGMLHTAFALFGRGVFTRPILDAVRFHFILIANPDGYDYSRRRSPPTAKHWCKNRRVLGKSHGVDLERNWGTPGISWGFGKTGKGASKHSNYQGPYAFSESETRAIRDYISHFSTGRGRSALLHVRCCSGSVTPPKYYDTSVSNISNGVDPPPPANKPMGISVDVVAKFLAKTITPTPLKYQTIQRGDSIGRSDTGRMIDWAYSEANIEHAYEVDFRASGLATHMNFDLINEKPFNEMAYAIERATIVITQLLLSVEITGPKQEFPFTKGIIKPIHAEKEENITSTSTRNSMKLKTSKSSKQKHKQVLI